MEHELGDGGREDEHEQRNQHEARSPSHGSVTMVTARPARNFSSSAADRWSSASAHMPYESTSNTSSDGLASAKACTRRADRSSLPTRTRTLPPGSTPRSDSCSGATFSWQLP